MGQEWNAWRAKSSPQPVAAFCAVITTSLFAFFFPDVSFIFLQGVTMKMKRASPKAAAKLRSAVAAAVHAAAFGFCLFILNDNSDDGALSRRFCSSEAINEREVAELQWTFHV